MDFLKDFSNSVGGWASAIAAALIGLAVYLPKISNGMKADRLDGNVLDRLSKLEAKSEVQDVKIHKQAVRITKLVQLVIELEGHIHRGVPMTNETKLRIIELTTNQELGE